MRPLKKIIDVQAFAHNWQRIGAVAPTAQRMAVVKADAYGHGVKNLLPVLQQAPMLAVACIEEALAVRALGLPQPVLLLEGFFHADELPLCVAQGFLPCVHAPWQLAALHAARDKPAMWLKVDTGMHRLGFMAKDRAQVLASLAGLDCRGMMTHFACADEEDLTHAQAQLADFHAWPLWPDGVRSAANSAAVFAMPDAHFDWVRPGLALYGMSPFAHRSAEDLGLRAVMTVQTEILAVRYLEQGESAGYGCGFVADKSGYLATIALGYGDGFARRIDSGKVMVRIGEACYPLVGRVAMDMCLVWLGQDALDVGSTVVIFGAGHAVESVAQQAGTIPYTLTTMLTPRVPAQVRGA